MRCRGIGPVPCEFFVCAESPGWEEDRDGIPLVGKTGKEFNRFMDGIDLPTRDAVYLTNLYKFYGGKNYEYTPEDLANEEPELIAELCKVKPTIIITLGRHATRWFMGDVDMDDVRGIPWYLPESENRAKMHFLPDTTVVFPIVHPAAGFHNPEMSPLVVAGFQELARYLDGKLDPRKLYDDPYPEPHYEEITTLARLREVCTDEHKTVAIDSEGYTHAPWSLQFSFVPGAGYLIRATRPELLREFGRYLRHVRPRITYHNSLHDLAVLRVLGIETNDLIFDDTMVMAYLLQIEPQGLKPLCLRLANMKMSSYDEVIGDAGDRLALGYLTWLWDGEQLDYEQRQQEKFNEINSTPLRDKRGKIRRTRDGKIRYRRTTKPPNVPKTSLHKAVERCLVSKRPRGLWLDQIEDILVAGYRCLGSMPEATLDYVEPPVAIAYGCRDADGTTRIKPQLSQRIDDLALRRVYDLELGTYPLIDRMSSVGMLPDLPHFAGLSVKLQGEIDLLQTKLAEHTGISTFNANSGDQVAAYLEDTLGLELGKRTEKGRGSTNDKILEGLEHETGLEVITDIRGYREYYKLKNTFVDRIPDFVNRWPHDKRIHSTFRTTRVITGRLAASDPNILALPKHGKFAGDFRRGFIAPPDHYLCSWDLSQIELRILAHLSQDPVMLAIFRGEKRNPDGSMIDLHAVLAERIFGVKPKDQDKSKHRLPAKAVNFGLPMGMTNIGLTVELRKNGVMIDEDDAQRWIDETMGLYKGVPRYQNERIAEARRKGYVRCLSGRIRYIGGIRSKNERVRSEAERFAFSTPIQEGAQLVMKTNEAVLWNEILVPLWRDKVSVEPLVQVHDDLVLQAHQDVARDLHPMMVECMTKSYTGLSVPIETSGDYGLNWCDMETF